MGIILQNEWRNRAIFAAIIIMLISLFVSRAFLSVSIIVFLALTIIHTDIISQFVSFGRSPLLISMSFLFFIPFISGLWSSNWQTWFDISRIKLPFLLLPIAFAGHWQLREKQWRVIANCFVILVLISCCWSLFQYFQNAEVINEGYLKAKTLPTPLSGDHVRFSWMVSIAVVCCALLVYTTNNKKAKLLLILAVILLVIYLHVLSARTGLALVYIFFLYLTLYLLVQRKRSFVFIAGGIVTVAIASWLLFPSLQNRIKYIMYDFSFLKDNNNIPGTSDANRLISLKAGWDILQQNPFGIGAGDIRDETNKWYEANVTNPMTESDKLFPSSEWIIYGDMAGWPAVLLFTGVVLLPLFIKNIRHRFFWVMLVAMSIGCCLVETTLEIQFGIFIYCFTLLWWWKWLKIQNK
jgi:O-antigen ligase